MFVSTLQSPWVQRAMIVGALTSATLWSNEALAQSGTRVLYYTGNNAMTWGYTNTSTFRSELLAAGATGFDETSTWPSSLTTYRVVVVIGGSTAYSSAQQTAMRDFAAGGGALVLVSDAPSYGYNANLNAAAATIGTPLRFTETTLGGGCETTTSLNGSLAVNSGVTAIGWGFGSSVSGGTWMWGSSSSPLAAQSGTVIFVGDGNAFNPGSCALTTASTNPRWYRNLWSIGCSAVTWYFDGDGDGYGGSTSVSACTSPGSSWTRTGGDCNDSNAAINPGATEIVGDGVDQNCDGLEVCYRDNDQDGWRTTLTTSTTVISCARSSGFALTSTPSVDCDDFDAATFPGATEIVADGKDQSCDGREICYQDNDQDGWRTNLTTSTTVIACSRSSGFALRTVPGIDCDDFDAATYPGAPEIVADGKDQSCSGTELCYTDTDLDGWRSDRIVEVEDITCTSTGLALATVKGIDCDDDDATIYPGATEIPYDGIDQDCSGADLCDVDADGWDAGIGACFGLDCADEDPTIHPRAVEIWYDGVDQNCDGWSDFDSDFDGFDSADHARPDGTFGDDCDDGDPAIHPNADEIWYDGVDQNCDGWSDYDSDFDGFDSADHARPDGTFGDDCDDGDPAIHPNADEIWYDGVDQDCDGWSDFDADFDGFDTAWVRQPNGAVGDDCDDDDATVYPGAPSLPDGKDNNCDGITDLTDSDGDGIPDEIEVLLGTDPHNPDTDGDGLWDGFEVGDDWENPVDSDGDGTIDALDPDDDGDGIPTRIEVGPTSTPRDTDGDGTPDYLDLDSDGDGWPDAVEGDVDTDRDGVPDYRDLDSDGDGVLDADELDADTDGDGAPNRIDPDDDGDGWATAVEQGWDPRSFEGAPDYWANVAGFDPRDIDGDGTPNYLDEDSDGDGRLDADEGHGDDDCDGLPNVLDPDDADGPCGNAGSILTFQSGACTTSASGASSAWLLVGLLGLLGLRRRR
jgi:MYXO-CTERM domain-containing protein